MNDRKAFFISYDGTLFHGFQVQDDLRTVQKEVLECMVESAVEINEARLTYSGRTDAGVSALWQTISFFLRDEALHGFIRCLNSKKGILVWGLRERLPYEFHASRSAIYRDYIYIDTTDKYTCPDISFLRVLSNIMARSNNYQFLYKDWRTPPYGSDWRMLYFIRVLPVEQQIIIHVRGEGFAWNMVRRIVDFLRKAKCRCELNECIDKWVPGAAEPQNLFLVGVRYPIAPKLIVEISRIINSTFLYTKIKFSVLSALKRFLSMDRLVYSPYSLA